MLYKKRKVPPVLQGLQALLNRLSPNHSQYSRIEEDVRRRRAGFAGEENFDKYIKEFQPIYPYGLLHDVCLIHDGVYFQMDSLLITPGSIIIFEIKNLAGKIIVKSNPTQFIQENNGVRKVIQNPITELNRKKIFLGKWLKQHGFTTSIDGIIGLAFTNELFIEDKTDTEIAFTQEIPILLYDFVIENMRYGSREIGRIANLMIKHHQEYTPFPLTHKMEIPKTDILSGVICPKCNCRGMKWQQKKWVCVTCTFSAADCHISSINDWFYLIDNKITNRNFRTFAGIDNRHTSKRLLQKAELKMQGKKRHSKYVRNPFT